MAYTCTRLVARVCLCMCACQCVCLLVYVRVWGEYIYVYVLCMLVHTRWGAGSHDAGCVVVCVQSVSNCSSIYVTRYLVAYKAAKYQQVELVTGSRWRELKPATWWPAQHTPRRLRLMWTWPRVCAGAISGASCWWSGPHFCLICRAI